MTTYTPRNEFGPLRSSKRDANSFMYAKKNGLLECISCGAESESNIVYISPFLAHVYFPRMRTVANQLVYENSYPFQRIAISSAIGLPYGGYARLILLDMMRRARIQKTREICLGMSLGQYLKDLGVHNNGRIMNLIQELLYRFKFTTFCLEERTEQEVKVSCIPVFSKFDLWDELNNKKPKPKFWEHRVEISQEMLTLACSDGYPIDFRIFSRLVHNTLAFDLMLWLPWRIRQLSLTRDRQLQIPLETLQAQFYPDCPSMERREFKRKIRTNMKLVFLLSPWLENIICFDDKGTSLILQNKLVKFLK